MPITQGFELVTDIQNPRIRAWGRSINELFSNCLRALAALIQPTVLTVSKKAKKIKKTLRVEAVDTSTLLVEFLSEVVRLSDAHNILFTDITLRNIGDDFLEGELSGVPVEDMEREIKAISYDEIEIRRNPVSGLYETTLVFDV